MTHTHTRKNMAMQYHQSKERPRAGRQGSASRSLLLPYQRESSGPREHHCVHSEHLTACITNPKDTNTSACITESCFIWC